jgi:hypothetical protein
VIVVLAALVLTGSAQAFTCPTTPLDERIAAAEGVFVGSSVGFEPVSGNGVPLRDYRFEVKQKVKGLFGDFVTVRIPARPANGGQAIPEGVDAGILMNKANGVWFTTRCGISDPGAVLAAFDEPKGNAVKLLIGIVILLAVVGYSVWRLKRRPRPVARSSR